MAGARRAAMVALAVVALGAGACGSSAPGAATTRTSTSGSRTATTGAAGSATLTGPSVAQIEQGGEVTVGGKQMAVPAEVAGHPISRSIDDGQQIIISAGGLLPARLFSTPNVAVTWTNLTDEPQRVIFDYLPVRSPLIAPGGTFSWTSQSSQSIAYKTASGLHGVDTVNPPFG